MDTLTLSDSLGITDVPMVPTANLPDVPMIIKEDDTELDIQTTDDVNYARQNIYQFVEFGKSALQSALALTQQSESARTVEAFATLLKSVADVNKQLVDVQEQKSRIRKGVGKETTVTTNNALFCGSTAELALMLKGLKDG